MSQHDDFDISTSNFAGIKIIKQTSKNDDDNSILSDKKPPFIDRNNDVANVTERDLIFDSVTSTNNDFIEPKILTFSTEKPTKKPLPSKRKAPMPKKMCERCGKLGHDISTCTARKRKKSVVRPCAAKKVKKTKKTEATHMKPPPVDVSKCIYIVIDLETTGFSRERNRIMEIASTALDKDGTVISGSQFESLVNPKQFIPSIISELTNITEDMVENQPTFDIVGLDFIQHM